MQSECSVSHFTRFPPQTAPLVRQRLPCSAPSARYLTARDPALVASPSAGPPAPSSSSVVHNSETSTLTPYALHHQSPAAPRPQLLTTPPSQRSVASLPSMSKKGFSRRQGAVFLQPSATSCTTCSPTSCSSRRSQLVCNHFSATKAHAKII